MDNKIISYYDKKTLNNNDYNKYRDAQIKRCLIKIIKQRNEIYYKSVCNNIEQYLKSSFKNMICFGSRNKWEKQQFQKYLHKYTNIQIYDLDICEQSNCDYTYDFQKLPADFKNKWDIIFTNSLDHSISPLDTVNYWYDFLKMDGLLIIGYEPNVDENHVSFGKYDCSTLPEKWYTNLNLKKYNIIRNFICNAGENSDHVYYHIVLQKK